jgi:hypothetical protein
MADFQPMAVVVDGFGGDIPAATKVGDGGDAAVICARRNFKSVTWLPSKTGALWP